MRASLLLLLVVLAGVAAGCGGGGSSSTSGCADVDVPAARDPGTQTAPSAPLPTGKTYALTFETSCGSFTVTLDPESAPKTSASLVALAKDGYFDNTIFHRVVRGFVIQGGDPTQTGGGGPGYSTVDRPPSDAKYTKGVVAMAKTEAEPPGTAGSQFFVVTADDASLPSDYAIVGTVTDGMSTVERIDALGVVDDQGTSVSGPPTKPVVIDRVTVTES